MNPRLRNSILAVLLPATMVLNVLGQGAFQNLDFEHPILPLVPAGGGQVLIAGALPGWTGYLGGIQTDTVWYDTVSIGGAAISFHDSMSPLAPFSGSHFVVLQASYPGGLISPTLAQVGQIPLSAQSLVFYTYNVNIQVSFAGQPLPVLDLGSAGGATQYRKVGADIAAFAGQTGELGFSAVNSGGSLDFIQFSDQPIPEPSIFNLFVLGSLFFGWRCVRKRAGIVA